MPERRSSRPGNRDKTLKQRSTSEARAPKSPVGEFLRQVAATPVTKPNVDVGRLIFALDATMSREPTWDMASQIQADMFGEASALGGLYIQLIYFRGFRECKASRWTRDSKSLQQLMTGIQCRAGHTQIGRVLRHALSQTRKQAVQAVVFVGDSFEESIDHVCELAGQLGLLNVPVFLFHEGDDTVAASAFSEIARLTGGAYCRFDPGSAETLKELLRAVAVYAAGGRGALANHRLAKGGAAKYLLEQLK